MKVRVRGQQLIRYAQVIEMTEREFDELKKNYEEDPDLFNNLIEDWLDLHVVYDSEPLEYGSIERLGHDGKSIECVGD